MTSTAKYKRCSWCGNDPQYVDYHDKEWGVPCHDEHQLFTMLVLEGHQAGLSWLTILKKRPAIIAAYDNFDPQKMASWDSKKIAALSNNPAIIRNQLKIRSAQQNATALLALHEKGQTLDQFLWNFVDGQPIVNRFRQQDQIPASTELSTQISRALKKAGFNFVGPTIVYAYMQAIGMVNDHVLSCYRHQQCTAINKAGNRKNN